MKLVVAYLRDELQRLASRPSIDRWLEQVRERLATSRTRMPTEDILRHLDAVRGRD